MRDELDEAAHAGESEPHQHHARYHRCDHQPGKAVFPRYWRQQNDEGGGWAADLHARAAEHGDHRSRYDCGVQAVLRRNAARDRQGHGQGQRHHADHEPRQHVAPHFGESVPGSEDSAQRRCGAHANGGKQAVVVPAAEAVEALLHGSGITMLARGAPVHGRCPIPLRYSGAMDSALRDIALRHDAAALVRSQRAAARIEALMARLPAAAAVLRDEFTVTEVVLFGSLAHGDAHEDSDVDLAVAGLPPERTFAAIGQLMHVLGADVDLVRMEEAGPSLLGRIRTEGRAL